MSANDLQHQLFAMIEERDSNTHSLEFSDQRLSGE